MVTEDALLAPSTEILVSPSRELQPAPLFTPTPKAAKRVLEFFTAQINNRHTRKGTVKLSGILGFWRRNRSSVERRINNLGSGQGAD